MTSQDEPSYGRTYAPESDDGEQFMTSSQIKRRRMTPTTISYPADEGIQEAFGVSHLKTVVPHNLLFRLRSPGALYLAIKDTPGVDKNHAGIPPEAKDWGPYLNKMIKIDKHLANFAPRQYAPPATTTGDYWNRPSELPEQVATDLAEWLETYYSSSSSTNELPPQEPRPHEQTHAFSAFYGFPKSKEKITTPRALTPFP